VTDNLAGTEFFDAESDTVWEEVGKRLESFLDAWDESDSPPDLLPHVAGLNGFVRRLVLIELIKVDLEQRWDRKLDPIKIEDYADRFEDLSTRSIPADLIYEEYHVRLRNGDRVGPAQYLRRFPNQASELLRLLDVEDPLSTTSAGQKKATDALQPGDHLDDFELLTKLGKGAFASVFLARQKSMQRMVALKISADHGHEPQTLAKLDHPHIVRVYDQKTLADPRLRLLYMQYVSGGTLQSAMRQLHAGPYDTWNGNRLVELVDEVLDDHGMEHPHDSRQRQLLSEMSWPEVVCHLGRQLAEALNYAHRQGVLHRDLKPANILLTDTASPKLVDFNISSCSKIDGASPTAYFGGSLAYMSPEHLEASNPRHDRMPESLDARTDVYALGIVLWELLTGARPFRDRSLPEGWSATTEEMANRRRQGIPEIAFDKLPPDCPASVREVLDKALRPDPEDRFDSAAEMSSQLKLCLNPEARELLTEPRGGLRRLALLWPASALLLTIIVPHALAGWFNYCYNRACIIDKLDLNKQAIFDSVQITINSIAYPLGAVLGLIVLWSVRRNLAATPVDADDLPRQQRVRFRCLKLGHIVAVLGTLEWLAAGVAYLILLNVRGLELAYEQKVHWFVGIAMCGLIASAYPYFGSTVLGLDVFYPALIRPHPVPRSDIPSFAWLHRVSWRYLIAGAGIPLVSLALLIFVGDPNEKNLETPLTVLFVGGSVMFIVVFRLARRVQRDLAILTHYASEGSGDNTGELTASNRVLF